MTQPPDTDPALSPLAEGDFSQEKGLTQKSFLP